MSTIGHAQLVTWNFRAKVSQKIGSLPEISTGDEITGSITFISDAQNIKENSSTEASYRAIDNIRLKIINDELISKNKDIGFNKIVVRNNNSIGILNEVEDAWLLGRDLHDPVMFVNK
jgi:hypothetical protein